MPFLSDPNSPTLANDAVSAIDQAGTGQGQAGATSGSTSGLGVNPLSGKPNIIYRKPGSGRATPGSANAAEHNMVAGLKEPWGQVTEDTNQASIGFWSWPAKDRDAFAKRAWYLGLTGSPTDIDGAQQAWAWAVEKAGEFALAGNPMDPRDVMELLAAGSTDAVRQAALNARAGQTVTQKQRQINISDPVSARAIIDQAFQQAMGRDASDAEFRTMLASLNSAQRANPSVTATTTKYDNQGNPLPDSTSVTTGGVDANAFAAQAAQADPESTQYQAGTFYFNTLMNALASPV